MILEKANLNQRDTIQFTYFLQAEASHKSLEDYFVQYSMVQNTTVQDFSWNMVNLRHIKLENMVFENGEIHDSFINESVLRNVTFKNVHFKHMNMDETDFDNVIFDNCTFSDAFTAWDVDLAKIMFINSKSNLIAIHGALSDISFEGVTFETVDLSGLKEHSSIEAKNCNYLKIEVDQTVLDKCLFENIKEFDIELSNVNCSDILISGGSGELVIDGGKSQSIKAYVDKLKHLILYQTKSQKVNIYSKNRGNTVYVCLDGSTVDKFSVENIHAEKLILDDAKVNRLIARNLMLLGIDAVDAEIGYFHLENVKVNGPIDYTNLQVDEIFIDKTRHLGSGTAEGALIKKGTRLGLYDDEPSRPYYLERVRGPHVYGILNK